ncbi:hypothetical protein UFOVP781_21 [uncultured Caudovirales phage]|uniref:Uncharacterized protein n=1 Tax=uncultured Caudovirales phage TaxID=2100421 RepID=A0A6J5LS70_9CAUD|nr:hypothetical protein UFOVP279_42 [uncultured Caudovirales phage]CAB4162166.1 hypothetical protein UFOVP781_21 [uncultured Caudovirales phage]
MTLDLANVTKADVYAAAQDLGERLARQIALNKVLHDDINKLASRPCIECDIVMPALRDRLSELETRYEQACELLGQIDAGTVSVQWGSVVSFIEKRRELNAARKPTEAAGSPV